MAVLLSLYDGDTREFPEATDAFKRGGLMYVTNAEREIARLVVEGIVSATIVLPDGKEIVIRGSDPN